MRLIYLWNILCLLAVVPRSTFASVLAIDYGTNFIKASLMKPGLPFDVLLDKDSKRKMQSAVGWKRAERLFGSDAANLVLNFLSVTEFVAYTPNSGHQVPFRYFHIHKVPSGGTA